MEINITRFFNEACPRDYSASVAEMGTNAARDTWSAAMEDAEEWPMLNTNERRDAFRGHIKDYGAWDDEEIDSWNNQELEALFIQEISSVIREFSDLAGGCWKEWQSLVEEGITDGSLFKGVDSEIYYYVGN